MTFSSPGNRNKQLARASRQTHHLNLIMMLQDRPVSRLLHHLLLLNIRLRVAGVGAGGHLALKGGDLGSGRHFPLLPSSGGCCLRRGQGTRYQHLQ